MNEFEFKRHLKDLVHGHHHTEEHDWDAQPGASRKPRAVRARWNKAPRRAEDSQAKVRLQKCNPWRTRWRPNPGPLGPEIALTRSMTRQSSRWSQRVTETSNALDLEPNVFRSDSPRRLAASLKRSAERSRRRKGTPFQSAMSMLNFYINRAGKNLPAERKRVLTDAKTELRRLFGK